MTVTADNEQRVALPVKPGDRFDVQLADGGRMVLTPLAPDGEPSRVRLVKKHGYTVAAGTRIITQQEVRRLLDDFPRPTCWTFRP